MRGNYGANSKNSAPNDGSENFRGLFKREPRDPSKYVSRYSLVEDQLWISD